MSLDVKIIASTKYYPDVLKYAHGFEPDENSTDAANLAEVAGRACYQSWDRPNPRTASNEGYLANIIDHKHTSTFEHGTVTFLFSGLSRSCTHELVRHRHFSYSQLSQRYCPLSEGYEVPPLFQGDEEWQGVARSRLAAMWAMSAVIYDELVELAQSHQVKRKQAREAARAVLPNMTSTQIVVTGNHRAWREFLVKRASPHADAEIRELAVEVFRHLRTVEPHLYQDMTLQPSLDGFGPEVLEVWS